MFRVVRLRRVLNALVSAAQVRRRADLEVLDCLGAGLEFQPEEATLDLLAALFLGWSMLAPAFGVKARKCGSALCLCYLHLAGRFSTEEKRAG
jgi:hypothetical protein